MRLTSSYGMKLKGDFKALETSIELYRKALRMLIPIINDGWDLIGEYRYVNQKYNLIEKWIHNTRTNRARFDFDEQFPKFPTYLRRSAIAKALGIVSSYRSNLENWEREGKGQTPKLSLTHFTYPAYYKGNLFRNFDPVNQTIELKVFKNNDWVYEVYQLKTSDCNYYQTHLTGKKQNVPIIQKKGRRFYTAFSYEEETNLIPEKGKDGWLKEAVSQNLIYKSEPNAVAKVSASKNAQPISANGIKRAFEAIQLKAYYIDALVADSRSYKIAIDSTTTAPEKVSKIKGEGGLGGPDNKEFIAYRVGRDSSVTIDYTNLTNSTYAGKPLSKVSMTLDVDPSSINISEYGVLAFAQNPQHGFNINFRRNDQANGHYALKFKVTMKFYDADGKLIDLKSDAYLGLSSLNSTVGPGTVEGFTLGNGTQEVGITGSSIQKQGDKYYSTVPNNTSNVFGQANIDSPSNPYFWYMGSALRLTGTAPSFNIFSGDPEYVGRKRIDSYIPGLWMTVTSNIAAKTAINPGQPPVEPKKPVSPAASEPVEPTAPKAPKAPVKPIEPEKPTVTEPPKPDLTPVAPPTPPTPKLVQKPNEPVDTAGEKPKEPKVPRVEKPKEPTDNAGTPPVKPVKPTPVSPVKASINVNKVTIERITNWVTTDGKVLKNPVIDKDFKPKDNFEGYEFVETKVEGNKTTHIYQPIQKQTRWITTDGKVLKNPVIDKDFKPKDNFEGYEFVETKVEGNTTTHIYQPIPKKTVTTIWVTEDGQVLRPRENGEQPKDNFDGYEYVRTDKDKDGNVTHVYKPIPKKNVTTIWVTEDGQVLRPRENGEQPKDNFDGYTYVRTEKDKDGNIRHIYKPVPKQPTAKELPKTGDASAIASIIGLGLTALGVTTLSRRKR